MAILRNSVNVQFNATGGTQLSAKGMGRGARLAEPGNW